MRQFLVITVMHRVLLVLRLLIGLVALGLPAAAPAASAQVAVAANFAGTAQVLAEAFAQRGAHRVALSFASTGKLLAQISNGAPFDVLLAADQATVQRLIAGDLAVPASRFTYATGRLALWSADARTVDAQGAVLRTGRFAHLAIANPALAPYGAAAQAVLHALELEDALRPRLVYGENIAQTYQFVASGNAELGFVALAQVFADGALRGGSAWIVPENRHPPLHQDAVLLRRGADNPAARAWLEFLAGTDAERIIRRFGYSR